MEQLVDLDQIKLEEEVQCQAREPAFKGYLNKLSSKGLMKTWKKRWFIYHNVSCQLRYFNSPQDDEPIDVMRISDAVFTFEPCKDHSNVFRIRTSSQDYVLEAPSREVCYEWLRNLQNSRRNYSLKRTKNLDNNLLLLDNAHPETGLLSAENPIKPKQKSDDLPTVHEELSTFKNKNLYSDVKKHVISALKYKPSSRANDKCSSDPEVFQSNNCRAESLECSKDVNESKSKNRSTSFRRRFRLSKEIDGSATKEESKLKYSCCSCQSLQQNFKKVEMEKENMEQELLAGQEVIKVLQQHVAVCASEKDTVNQLLDARYGNDFKDLLSSKLKTINELEQKLQNQESLLNALMQERGDLRTNLENYEEQCSMLKDLLSSKDESVVSLTNKIFDLESKLAINKESSSEQRINIQLVDISSPSCKNCSELQDGLDAYQFQNQFLNSEIVELNKIVEDSNVREEKLSLLSSTWEAQFCQVQSKYLLLLKEIHSPKSDLEESTNLVSQLVQDALEHDAKNQNINKADSSFQPSKHSKYDELGFNKLWGMDEDDILGQKAVNFKHRSKLINDNTKTVDHEHQLMKWDNFMANVEDKEFVKSLELKLMIRLGIPSKYRSTVWKRCIDMKVKNIRSRFKSSYYHSLLASHTKISKNDPCAKQIELDLLRTLPNNKHYESMHSDGISRLRRVLLAYSWHNPSVGYCQGINRLAAIALLFLEEEDSFWCLVAIIDKIMPIDYYSTTLITSQVDQRVLKDLMQEKLPRLYSHLQIYNVDLSLVTFTWLLTVFVDNIPVKTYLNIWDAFLYEGSKVLFRYALAIFMRSEEELLKLHDYMTINMYLQNMARTLDDIKALTQLAFHGLPSFSMRSIASKRTHHMQIVRKELEALAAIRTNPDMDEKDDSCSDDEL